MSSDVAKTEEFCKACRVGSLQPFRATYARWHDEQFVVMAGILAWRCDFCSDTYFDDDALTRLVLLLGPETTLEDQRRRRVGGLGGGLGTGLGSRRRVA